MSCEVGQSPRALRHKRNFDVTIEKSDCDIKNMIVMQKIVGFWPTELDMWTLDRVTFAVE